jgi:SAM-dependent methyltransferase
VTLPSWAPGGVDYDRPSPARVYDAHLGGFHNFAVDREVARRIAEVMPELPEILRANRSFLRRAVRYLLGAGITQFLDLGSGIPTVGNVHEVAQQANPASRVVYVDIDPVAVAHGEALLAGDDRTVAVQADLRQPEQVLSDPRVRHLLDFDQPMAVLMVAVLQFVADADDPAGIVARYLDAVVPGSYLVVSHASQEGPTPGRVEEATEAYSRTVTDFWLRSRAEVTALFAGTELVDPGVVYLTEWHPDSPEDVGEDPGRMSIFAGVGRKR